VSKCIVCGKVDYPNPNSRTLSRRGICSWDCLKVYRGYQQKCGLLNYNSNACQKRYSCVLWQTVLTYDDFHKITDCVDNRE